MTENKIKSDWITVHKDITRKGIKVSFKNNLQYTLAKDQYTATVHDLFMALSITVRDRLVERWIKTQQRYHKDNLRRVYYFSMEFLIGRLLADNISNLGIWDSVRGAMDDIDINIEDLLEEEADAGLGNGGLGRLAACFLDSMATLGIPAHGYGIRYDYGIFNQKIINGYQIEFPDEWLKMGMPWEFARPEYAVKVRFYGRTFMFYDNEGRLQVRWLDTEDVLAMPYDVPIPGYKNDVVNTLRLWSARSTEDFDLEYFNYGDYERAVYNKVSSENISKVLYPSDMVSQGRELRLKQEYFFTAASIADIIRRFKIDNNDLTKLPEKTAIQLNDTHPSLAIPELMRILIDEERLEWDTAWSMTTRIFAYTNHTVMPEALESWPVGLMELLLPRHLQIIYEINLRFLQEVSKKFPGDNARLRRMSIIDEDNPKKVRMSHLAIVGSFSINGVSELHTELLKKELFLDFYEFSPWKFNSKTNGITQRRWLMKANSGLSELITSAIGESWSTDLYKLKKLNDFKDDHSFKEKWDKIKKANKGYLANYIVKTTGITVDPASIFDVQIKRIHEYKRQVLFAFYIISQYLLLKRDPGAFLYPRTFIFSGKAAPGYIMAKQIIKFINNVAETINRDNQIDGKIKVIFLENYRVSLAEKIFPASDLSEQISTAGTEASGTGCMKFMVNGALTMGTLDGANIEIAKEAGQENIFMFGMDSAGVQQLRSQGYRPQEYINASPVLSEVFKLISSNFFSPVEFGLFDPLINNLTSSDFFMVCADFDSYFKKQEEASGYYRNRDAWLRSSIINVANSGKFSGDRTIREYSSDIWKVPFYQQNIPEV